MCSSDLLPPEQRCRLQPPAAQAKLARLAIALRRRGALRPRTRRARSRPAAPPPRRLQPQENGRGRLSPLPCRSVRESNIVAAKSVADAVRTSLGPRGMDKMAPNPAARLAATHRRLDAPLALPADLVGGPSAARDRKSTRLNSSH